MILLFAVAAGWATGQARAWLAHSRLQVPELRAIGLVTLAFLPQYFAFYAPATRSHLPDGWIAAGLILSQGLLLAFAWLNRGHAGFAALGLGLLMNFSVITLNGGWMPISPETVRVLAPHAPPASWQVGERLGVSKDRVLPIEQMRLPWLRDRFVLPHGVPFRAAFSVGDALIALGVIWLFWHHGAGGVGRTGMGETPWMSPSTTTTILRGPA